MSKSVLQKIYYIGFILIFFTTFVIYIVPNSGFNVPVGMLFWASLPLLLLIGKPISIINFYKRICQTSVMKWYLLSLCIILGTTVVHILLGSYSVQFSYYFVRILDFFIVTVLMYLYIPLCVYLKIPMRNVYKLLYLMILGILIIGIIEYLMNILNITFLKSILDFFTNLRFIMYEYVRTKNDTIRIHSLFEEPSALGQFIFIFMPFILNVHISKWKLFKNRVLNYIVKKTTIPLMFLNLIFTESPIYLIFCLVEFFILEIFINRKWIKIHIIQILTIIFVSILLTFLIFYTYNIALSNTYLNRILIVFECFNDFDKLVSLEPSLATRVISYTNQFIAFIHNPFWGVGLYNSECYLNSILLQSPLPLTSEILSRYFNKQNIAMVNKSLFYTGLAEFGGIWLIIYCVFIYKNCSILKCLSKYASGVDKIFIESTMQTIIMINIIGLYNLPIISHFIWIIYGLVLIALLEGIKLR